MEGIHQWIVSITAASMLTALCQAMMPAGAVKRVSNMTCGLLLFIVILRPVIRADYGQLLSSFADYYNGLGTYDSTLEETNFALTESIIARDTAAYIEDKAAETGITCTVTVQCGEKDGLTVPTRITVWGSLTSEEEQQVSAMAVEALAIEKDAVRFEEKEGGA